MLCCDTDILVEHLKVDKVKLLFHRVTFLRCYHTAVPDLPTAASEGPEKVAGFADFDKSYLWYRVKQPVRHIGPV